MILCKGKGSQPLPRQARCMNCGPYWSREAIQQLLEDNRSKLKSFSFFFTSKTWYCEQPFYLHFYLLILWRAFVPPIITMNKVAKERSDVASFIQTAYNSSQIHVDVVEAVSQHLISSLQNCCCTNHKHFWEVENLLMYEQFSFRPTYCIKGQMKFSHIKLSFPFLCWWMCCYGLTVLMQNDGLKNIYYYQVLISVVNDIKLKENECI